MSETCEFCKAKVPAHSKSHKSHLVVTKDIEDHIHTHGDIEKSMEMEELIRTAAEEIGLTLQQASTKEGPKEIIFHNRQRIGDIFMFTCAIRDFKAAFPKTRVNVMSTCSHIWDHNPAIDRTLEPFYSDELKARALKNGKKVLEEATIDDFPKHTNVIKIGPGRLTNASNRLDWHFSNAYRVSIEDSLKINIPQGESWADIWMTDEEYNAAPLFPFPYWIICVSGEKGWGCKMYPFERWQRVVDQNPELMFVQIGAKGDNPPRLQGKNVIDLVGQTEDRETGIRDLLKLFLNAEGSIGLVSFHMHLSGALHKPCVVVAGAREPVSFTRYPYQQYIATDGTLPCSVPACWHCGIDKCTNIVQHPNEKVPKCVDIIHPEEVTFAIRRYYEGGRLTLGTRSEKTKMKNIVKAPKVEVVEGKPEKKENLPPLPEGLDWGKGAIDPMDWPFIEEVIKKNQVETLLEFGAGVSTVLASKLVRHITSLETEQEWVDKIKLAAPKVNLWKWNGRNIPDSEGAFLYGEFDLAFVDGPANGQNREQATRIAVNHAKMVIIHDATREWESKWEEKYLKPGFSGPIKGGKWCHLWIKTPSFVRFPEPPQIQVNPQAKTIRIASTARGWGGAQRSVAKIMKMLLERGHKVEFLPFHKEVRSREFQDALKNGLMEVKVRTEYSAMREHADVVLFYADDFVWEFPKQELIDEFSEINADRKIMMINYRRGKIGEVPWTKGWDRYLFLNSGQEKEFLNVLPGASTGVLPPCTDLTPFFESQPRYEGNLRIVRHNSQGDVKFMKDGGAQINQALATREDLEIHMMPGPSFVPTAPPKFVKYSKNYPPIPKFLELGNLFWYSVPEGYMDMGPRVILEAMAAGLPILADPWGGAADRVTPECGWLCSKEEQIEIIKNVTLKELKQKGEAARRRAQAEFIPERWIEELLQESEICTAPTL